MPVRSVKDCRVASLLAMTKLKGFAETQNGHSDFRFKRVTYVDAQKIAR